MAVTIREVAREAAVSQATAARALGGYGYVGAESRRRVLSAARSMGYLPNNAARTLASGTSNLIGFVTADIGNCFFASASRGLADVVEEHGYTLIVANSDETLARERSAVDSLRANRVNGLVVAPANSHDVRHLVEAAETGLPIVLLDRTVRGLAVDSVVSDGRAGATKAVEHLLELGHRRIGIVADSAEAPMSSITERVRGWADTLRRAGIVPSESLTAIAQLPLQDGFEATIELLGRPVRPSALLTTSNRMTSGALRAVRELGIEIPTDLSLVAFDDFEVLDLFSPPVTAVAQPEHQLGGEAGRLLLARMQGDSAKPRRLRLSTELIVRASTARLRQRPQPARPVGAAALSKMAAFRAAAAGS